MNVIIPVHLAMCCLERLMEVMEVFRSRVLKRLVVGLPLLFTNCYSGLCCGYVTEGGIVTTIQAASYRLGSNPASWIKRAVSQLFQSVCSSVAHLWQFLCSQKLTLVNRFHLRYISMSSCPLTTGFVVGAIQSITQRNEFIMTGIYSNSTIFFYLLAGVSPGSTLSSPQSCLKPQRDFLLTPSTTLVLESSNPVSLWNHQHCRPCLASRVQGKCIKEPTVRLFL